MKYRMDPEDMTDSFEGWAFLHFSTTLPGYALADSLNRLYDLSLRRIDDLLIDGTPWPLYHHIDTVAHLKYFLLQRPVADHLLIIAGDTAKLAADQLYEDFTSPAAFDPADLLAREHADLLGQLLAAFTVASQLSFSDTSSSSRKAQKGRAALEQSCQQIIDAIEKRHLDLSDEEASLLHPFAER